METESRIMPRINPLPQTEAEYGSRLKSFRNELGIKAPALAKICGIAEAPRS